MITQPLSSEEDAELAAMVSSVARSTFPSDRVRAATQVVDGFDEVAWKQLIDLGWTQAGDPADEDLGPLVQCVVHRELGAQLAPSPYLSSVGFGAAALRLLGGTPEAEEVLAKIGDGSISVALVTARRAWLRGADADITATADGSAWKLTGEVPMALDAARASTLLVLARHDDGWGLFLVDPAAQGVERTVIEVVDRTRSLGAVALDQALGVPLSAGPLTDDDLDGLIDRMAVLLAAEMVGAAMACMQLTLDYLKTRQQFGRPIGSFQALKHRCADLAVDLTVVHETLFAAAEMIVHDARGLSVLAPLVLAQAGEVFKHTAEEAIQLHGGVGFTDEFDVGLYYKRALVDTEFLISTVDSFDRLADVLGGAAA